MCDAGQVEPVEGETESSDERDEEFLSLQIINYNSLRSGSSSICPPLYILVMWSVFCIFTIL